SESGLSGAAAASQPARRRRWRRNTLRGYAEHHKIPLRRLLRLLREGQLPVRVGWVDTPTPIREYARLQGIDPLRARILYQQGVLCPMVMPHPRGQASWPVGSGIAELVLLYTHAERQLRVARREADAYAWRLADLRRKARASHQRMSARLRLMRRRLRLFEAALRSRDVVLARLKHEAELGRALAGADKTIETIVRRALGAEAWE